MNIYDELKKDHTLVQSLLSELSMAESPELRRSLVTEIRDALVPHSRAEELVLYNVLRDMDKCKDLIMHSYQEHMKAETLLRSLQVTEAVALNWKGGVQKLREELDHHISEEEGKVFKAAHDVFSEEEARELGAAFSEIKPKIGAGVVSSQIELMTNLMPSRFRKTFSERLAEENEKARKSA